MSDIEITHTHEDGTLVDGTEKGDGAGPVLKRFGFRWFPSLRQFGIRGSRDRAARRTAIEAAAEALRAEGHTVTVTIDDTPRDTATVRADQHERLEDRRAALAAKADRLTAESDALHNRSRAMVEHIPLGQPVMPGRRGRAHRNLLERSVTTAIKGARTAREAELTAHRVQGSARAEAYRERPDVVKRRVDRQEAELRRIDRSLANLAPGTLRDQYEAERAVLAERIAGDKALLDEARAAGTFGQYSRDNVRKGDQVKIRGQWRTVARANPKTVSVETGYSWTDKYGYEEIRGHRAQPSADD